MQQINKRWPHAWTDMDRMRRQRPMPWPDWCLLPMAAAAAVTGTAFTWPPPPIAQVAAMYAWRYSRAVYVVEPSLMSSLLTQVPDSPSLEAFVDLPHWCVYVTSDNHPEFPGAGFWAHLEYDVNTGRPELRLLIDLGEEKLVHQLAVPVYLDRPSLTEALADWRANTVAQEAQITAGLNIRGGELDGLIAQFADKIDGYVSVLAYLARPEADIRCVNRPGRRPARPTSPVRDRTTWAVGYS